MIEHYDVYGLKVSNFELPDVEQLYLCTINEQKSIVIYGYSLGHIVLLKKHPELYPIINSFDLLVSDGTQFNWYCYFNGFKLKTVISIPNITNYTLEYADKKGLRVLLFGAKEEINKKASDNIQKKYPNLQIMQGIHGYYSQDDELSIVEKIRSQKPHILLVGISSPVKEEFSYKHKNSLGANIIIPCGGMIDVYSGHTRQSPVWIKKMGLATPFRIIQEPKRLFALRMWMISEILFKLIPLTFFNRCILGKKDFNIIDKYLGKSGND